MKSIVAILIFCLATPIIAQDKIETIPATEAELAAFLWTKRPVVIFADQENDPRFIEQLSLLNEVADALDERDVVVVTDVDPMAQSELRTLLRPHGFMFVLIGKDGNVKLRKPFPWDARELSRTIDKMPMRQEEIRREKASKKNGITLSDN